MEEKQMKIMAATICSRLECTLINMSVIINTANKMIT